MFTNRNTGEEVTTAFVTKEEAELLNLVRTIRDNPDGDTSALVPALAVRAKIAAGLDPREH